MSNRPIAALGVAALLVLAGCGTGGGASPAPSAAGPSSTPLASATSAASASSAASGSPAASGSRAAAAACRETADPGAVAVSIVDFEFKPASIGAKVGQVIAFTNTGFEPHNATVEAGCATRTLQTGESDGIAFTVPGSYRFGCSVHAWMTGTFTVAP
jgi:plastocyanin